MKKKTLKEWFNFRVTISVIHGLDKQMKRLVTIASLYGYLFDEKKRDKDLETRIASIMNLSNNSNSLTLPLIYHNIIWKEIESRDTNSNLVNAKSIITNKKEMGLFDARRYADLVISSMPAYLFYDSIDVVKEDITHMLISLPFINGERNGFA